MGGRLWRSDSVTVLSKPFEPLRDDRYHLLCLARHC